MNDIITGSYVPPPNTSTSTQDFLTVCKISEVAQVLAATPDIISRYQYQAQSWKIRKEKYVPTANT